MTERGDPGAARGAGGAPVDDEAVSVAVSSTARMEALSLAATYAFSTSDIARSAPGSRPLRIWFHEHMHVYQTAATSFGYYTTMLRLFQNSRAVRIIRLLGESSTGLAPPLTRQVRAQRPSVRAALEPEVDAWLLAELMVQSLEGDIDTLGRLSGHAGFRGMSSASLFEAAEHMLSEYFVGDAHDLDGMGARNPLRDDRREESQTLSLRAFMSTGAGDVSTVLESGARAAEFWDSWPDTFDDLDRAMPVTSRYTVWIKFAISRLGAPDPRSFLLAYSALADLALNPPVLPHHAGLRRPGTTMGDLNPFRRLLLLITNAGESAAPAIHDLTEDYVPFIEKTCAHLGWPTPMDLADVGVDRLPHPLNMPEPMTTAYKLSCLLRSQRPTTFLDLDVWSTDSDDARAFCGRFTHPVAQFDDDTWMFDRPQDSVTYVEQYIQHRYFSLLMTSTARPLPPIELPFRASPNELEFFTSRADRTIRTRTGLAQPRVRLVAGGGATHPM